MSSFKDTRTLGGDELRVFFEAVDRHLSIRVSIVVIGGAAAALHKASSTTSDVDTFEALPPELQLAVEKAAAATGIVVPISHSAIAQVPYNYDERLERVFPDLEMLEICVLEKHDLALSKIVRGAEHDMQQLEEVHQNSGLDFETLVDRFHFEMSHVLGEPQRIRLNFLELIERLFGELKRVSAANRLK
ncbi:MAG TPA: DUF6036 family nucleotidyltransferase [Gemmatimonadaceae bacterium]|nr:DUF6036 family nucleotidyltransferase [Gemmatimonadaceae bacterium]